MDTLKTAEEITSILKEEIEKIHFVPEDVLDSADQIALRRSQLQKAMVLGNNEKSKTKIVFATKEGLKKVETTVWAIHDDEVELKAGIHIPIHAICEVILL